MDGGGRGERRRGRLRRMGVRRGAWRESVQEGRTVVVVETGVFRWEMGRSQAMPEAQGGTVGMAGLSMPRRRETGDASRRLEFISLPAVSREVDGLSIVKITIEVCSCADLCGVDNEMSGRVESESVLMIKNAANARRI